MEACEESVSEVWKESSWERSRERGEEGGSLPRHLSSVKGSSVEPNRCRRAVKPFTWSKHTLNYSHLFTGAASMLRSLPSCPSAFPPFFSPSDEGFLPAKTLPLISWSVYCGGPLTKQLNDPSSTLTLLCCVSCSRSQLILRYVNTALMLWTSVFLPLHKQTIDPLKGSRAGSGSVRCTSRWIIQSTSSGWRSACFPDFLSPLTTEMAQDQLIVVVD